MVVFDDYVEKDRVYNVLGKYIKDEQDAKNFKIAMIKSKLLKVFGKIDITLEDYFEFCSFTKTYGEKKDDKFIYTGTAVDIYNKLEVTYENDKLMCLDIYIDDYNLYLIDFDDGELNIDIFLWEKSM